MNEILNHGHVWFLISRSIPIKHVDVVSIVVAETSKSWILQLSTSFKNPGNDVSWRNNLCFENWCCKEILALCFPYVPDVLLANHKFGLMLQILHMVDIVLVFFFSFQKLMQKKHIQKLMQKKTHSKN